MFHYNPDTDDLVEPIETFVPEVTPGAGDFDKLDPAQVRLLLEVFFEKHFI